MNSIPQADFRVEPADYTVDFKDLRSIREPVFVVEQQVPLEEEWDALDPKCHHVIARDAQNRAIGTGRLTPEHKIGRMAVLPEWRGKGVGEALLLALIEKARELGLREVTLNAQVGALGFYEKFGFAPYGERFEEAGIEHQAMRLELEPPVTSPGRRPGHVALRNCRKISMACIRCWMRCARWCCWRGANWSSTPGTWSRPSMRTR